MGCGSSNAGGSASEGAKKHAEYKLGTALGEGMSCAVYEATHKTTKEHFALKMMQSNRDNEVMFKSEVDLLTKVIHPNILEYVDHWAIPSDFCLLTKLCTGGELFDRIVDDGPFSEKTASIITHQMISSVNFCHNKSIVHRDLKPENFVYDNATPESKIRLIDFGCAVQTGDDDLLEDFVGSQYYMAPEVAFGILQDPAVPICGALWKKADVWSIGVIIYIIMTGRPPFSGSTLESTAKRIMKGKYSYPTPNDEDPVVLSDEVKDLISKCLVVNPDSRMSSEEALQHPWVKGDNVSDKPMSSKLLANISGFTAQNKLRKAVGKVLAQKMTDKDKDELQHLFKKYDVNGDGVLSPQEIVAMMKDVGVTEEEAKDMAGEMDEDGDGQVDMKELANVQALTAAKDNRKMFSMFDKDGDGEVTADEILAVCNFLTSEEVEGIMKQADNNSDGKLGFDEWVNAMGKMKTPK